MSPRAQSLDRIGLPDLTALSIRGLIVSMLAGCSIKYAPSTPPPPDSPCIARPASTTQEPPSSASTSPVSATLSPGPGVDHGADKSPRHPGESKELAEIRRRIECLQSEYQQQAERDRRINAELPKLDAGD